MQAARDEERSDDERAAARAALGRVEASLPLFETAPAELTAPVRAHLSLLRADLLDGQRPQPAVPREDMQRHAALEGAMAALDSHNASAVRALLTEQRRQFALAVAAALGLLLGLGAMVWRNLRRLEGAEQGLRDSEHKMRQMVELMPQLVWRTDARGRCDYLSRRWSEFTGEPIDRHLGQGWLDLVHADDRPAVVARWNEVLVEGDELQMEFRLRRHDGVYRWFDVRAGRVRDAQDRTLTWFGSCTDITDRKAYEADLLQHRDALETQVTQRTPALTQALADRDTAQRGLQSSNAQLRDAELFVRMVADNIPGRVSYWDKDRRCRFVNRAYSLWTGIPAETLVGMHLRDVRGPAVYEKSVAMMDAALNGQPQDFEREDVDPAGNPVVHRVQYLPHLRDGTVQGFFVLATDVTAHKRARQALQESNAQLAEARDRADNANRAKSVFLSSMSHEIRTPMNAILGLTHLLRRDVQDPLHRDRIGKVWTAARHLLDIVNDILDLSKIEAGKFVLEQMDFSLDALLTRTCSMMVDAAREKGLEVVLDTGGLPDRLNGDPTRLMQALLNLLTNAVKFTERGSVLLQGRLVAQEAERLEIQFEVRDTGIGIPADVLQRLFTPFAQGDSSTTRRQGGTGLGLAITRHIAELMDGEAGAASEPGRGSRFWIRVVLRPALQPLAVAMPALDGVRCLLADDLLEAREAMAEMLRALGLRVDTAGNGAGALTLAESAAAQADPYGLVVLDWDMPSLDGLEAARRLSAIVSPAPPMVLVSAHDRDDLADRARAAGFAAVLLKPVTPSALLDALMRALRGTGRAAPPERSIEALEQVVRERHRGARVLLAEDNPVNQEVAAELLQAAGLVVDVAQHGEEAVRMGRSGVYDLILMDVQMPYLDGLQATRQLRAQVRLGTTPIIAMTANAFAEDRATCLAAGMNDHLAKPIDPRLLHEMLLQWLPARQRIAQPVAAHADDALQPIAGLDLDTLLEQCAGRTELARRVLRQFLTHYREVPARLRAQAEAEQWEDAHRTLHSLRGASGAIGALALQAQVRDADATCRTEAKSTRGLSQVRAVSDGLRDLIVALSAQLGD